MTTDPRGLDLVVFDLDGVLADSDAGHARAFADLWARLGIEGPRYEAIAGMRTAEVVARVTAHLDVGEGVRAEWVEFKQTRAREYLKRDGGIFPDALPAVRALRSAGMTVSVGTGASRRTAIAALEAGALLPELEAVVTADDVARGKPAPDVFTEAIRRSGSAPDRTLVVEDTVVGLASADAAGAWSATVRTAVTIASTRFIGIFPDLDALVARVVGRS